MDLNQQVKYMKNFTDTYFSYSEEEKGKREAACLKVQFQNCLLPPSGEELLYGKYTSPCVGFGLQEAGMGYFINEGVYEKMENTFPEQRERLSSLRKKWLPETGRQQLIDKTPAHILREIPNDHFTSESNIGFWLCRMSSTQLDFDKLMAMGIPGLKEEVLSRMAQNQDENQTQFLQGLLAALETFCDIALYCAEQAELSQAVHGIEIAQVLRRITLGKPQTLWEAIQLTYLYALVSGTYNYGRMDEYLGDFLCRDLENGTLSDTQALALLTDLWKLIIQRKTTWNGRVMVGGRGRRNEEAADRFALFAIKVAGTVRDVLPQFSLRFYKGQNPRLLEEALQIIGSGSVYPILYNDDVNIPSVQKAFGVSEEEAEQYLPFGCGEYILYHSSVGTPSDIINLLKALEITLFNGYDFISGKAMGLNTGNFADFPDFESFFQAYCRQVEHYTQLQAEQQRMEYQIAAEHSPFLLASLLYDSCLERGRGIFDGGANYLGGTYETYGNTNTADSLTAIRRLVFEEKQITPDQLLRMLKQNFVGFEKERNWLLNAPKYGNDLEEADEMAVLVHEHICLTANQQAKKVGLDSYLVVVINNSANSSLGRFTMASADGRRAFEPMANANNPSGGSDKNGLTAMLNSLVKLKTDIHAGAVQNIKFSKEMFQKYFSRTRAVLDVYFENGGSQLMINVLGKQDLENAQREPEKYQNLIVRVGGFCARFVELSADVQKEVMSRTMY